MSDDKAARLAAIRAANKAKQSDPTATRPPTTATTATTAAAEIDYASMQPTVNIQGVLFLLIAAVAGALLATLVLPIWLPGLTHSLIGAEPKAYWYISRSSATVAYLLLWISTLLGLMMTNKLARLWPGGPVTFDLHQHTSLLGLAFAIFHALILLGDQYIKASLADLLTPFAYTGYQPEWVGVGQIGIYLFGLVGLSFYLKPLIGRTAWRALHFFSFALFGMVMLHGIFSGSDSSSTLMQVLYWGSGATTLFMTIYRILVARRSTSLKSATVEY